MQVPSNIIVGKVKYPGIYIGTAMAVWGMISACMAAVQSYVGLMLARFFIDSSRPHSFPVLFTTCPCSTVGSSTHSTLPYYTQVPNLAMLLEVCSLLKF